jgi:hypothetical protein
MKKIILTLITAIAFCFAGMAQEKDQQKKQQSTQYRTKKTSEQLSKQRRDSTYKNDNSRDMEDVDADPTGREIEKSGEDAIQQADSAAAQGEVEAKEASDELRTDSTQYSHKDIDNAGGEVQKRSKEVDSKMSSGTQSSGTQKDSSTEISGQSNPVRISTKDSETESKETSETSEAKESDDPSMQTGLSSELPPASVEVLEGKEGPNGEVVYRVNDELYYVDQTKQMKFVKVEEKDLRDSNHKVTVREGEQYSSDKKVKKGKSKS